MRCTLASVLALAAVLPSTVLAHYNFEALIVNGKKTDAYQYVRQTTNSNSPITDITSKNMICNQGGLDADIRSKTKTYTVKPGDEVGFTVDVSISHPGPLSVWMSKAPSGTTAQDYLGSGEWFKVYELTTSSITSAGLQWATYVGGGISNFTFALPDELPAGNYLMRAEHIALHAAGSKGGAQFYIGCAQLTVGGSGSGSPSPTTKIPGQYTGSEPGILIDIYYPIPTSYTAAGIKTWPGACVDHTANLLGKKSDGDCTGSSSSDSSGAASTPSAAASTTALPASSSTPAAGNSTLSTGSSGSSGSGSSGSGSSGSSSGSSSSGSSGSGAASASSAGSSGSTGASATTAAAAAPSATKKPKCSAKQSAKRRAKRAAKRAAEEAAVKAAAVKQRRDQFAALLAE